MINVLKVLHFTSATQRSSATIRSVYEPFVIQNFHQTFSKQFETYPFAEKYVPYLLKNENKKIITFMQTGSSNENDCSFPLLMVSTSVIFFVLLIENKDQREKISQGREDLKMNAKKDTLKVV